MGDLVLPKCGWTAQGAGVKAYTAVVNGVMADYAETETSVFANARNADHWNYAQIKNVRPQVARFEQSGPREFRVTYEWIANDAFPRDYHCFVHFDGKDPASGAQGVICFQNDHALSPPTSKWRKGTTVSDGPYTVKLPEKLGDGDYVCSAGLFAPNGGPRLPLVGVDDGQGRIRLGVLDVRDGGKSLTFEPEKATGEERLKLYTQNLNTKGKVLDFGTVRTNGSVLVRRDGKQWGLIPMPRDKRFAIELSAKRFGKPSRGTGS